MLVLVLYTTLMVSISKSCTQTEWADWLTDALGGDLRGGKTYNRVGVVLEF